ncbi:MAG TPA: hypothetical protein VFE51_01140 [Verrucomicrobiae bacterium]|nr:hypothetical protein [Verrucomicrobiae bacterium]
MKATLNLGYSHVAFATQASLDQATANNIIPLLPETRDFHFPLEKAATKALATVAAKEVSRADVLEGLTYLTIEMAAAALVTISLVRAIQ